jgi:putative phosphoesterase
LFAGVEHILHAGDVGAPFITFQLEQIAPVTAVIGNTDSSNTWRETEAVTLAGRRILVHHIVDPRAPSEALARRIRREKPEVVVFGHTHKPFCEKIGSILYFNPGYAGKPRFGMPRSLAIAECDEKGFWPKLVDL